MNRRILKDCAIVAGAVVLIAVFTLPLLLLTWDGPGRKYK